MEVNTTTAQQRREQGARLRQFLAEINVKQSMVARRIGVSASFVADACNGRKRITQTFAHTLQCEYGVDEGWLLTGCGDLWHVPDPTIPPTPAVVVAVPVLRQLPRTLDEIGTAARQPEMKLAPELAQPASRGKRRYVYIVPQSDVSNVPAILPGDHLLFEAYPALGRDWTKSGDIVAAWVGAGSAMMCQIVHLRQAPTGRLEWRTLAGSWVTITRMQERTLKLVGELVGIVWRNPPNLEE